ncbi:TetR/AcrR family transcriptional regulator [Pseudomonas sp. 5P_3.1_Bac2]|uniref:TetR/AcrR family transcriptional regulator n=1 Tax=Pseudomonas sp. 5P_3.1_Bac2 TaxID=2971617 RepID=UPI0021C6B909|nr:TetR/AcrR family transcriptional regulator [Pseudomonas sp. 5P_3.1_Bac2]MCU1716206.1 TetR/AcrR family transcriptional regulator [Pseudomonas sp. 5P_3.1_Bac2]
MSTTSSTNEKSARRRLPRAERQSQLLQVAWQLIRAEGTDALTLGRLAEEAGVTKPVVYNHFVTREGLLAALYEDFDLRQTALMDAAIAASAPDLEAKARVIASSYVDCVLTQCREIPEVLAALSGSRQLAVVKRQYQQVFIDKCQRLLQPFLGGKEIGLAPMWAMLGAADAVALAATAGEISAEQAATELEQVILAMVARSQ